MIAELPRRTVLSDDRRYRYVLWREWDVDLMTGCSDDLPNAHGYAMFIGVNPSTADETRDDPTIRKCIGFTKRWGYSALCMTNLFAFRATDPGDMKRAADPVGEDNQRHLLKCASKAAIIVAAWGANGKYRNQDLTVLVSLRENIGIPIMCLRHTPKGGDPEHPLYVPYAVQPIPFDLTPRQ